MQDEQLIKRIKARDAALCNEAMLYEPVWRDIRDYLAPNTAKFRGETVNKGERQDRNIINSKPLFAARTLPAGMQSGITSPLRPWFRFAPPDPEMSNIAAVKEWLYDTEKRMRAVIAKSNLYDVLKMVYSAVGNYGTGCLWLDEDDQDVIRAHHIITGTFRIATDAANRPHALHRDCEMTVEQMVQRFGKDKLPKEINDKFDKGDYMVTYKVLHVVEPNPKYAEGSKTEKKFISMWFRDGHISAEKCLKKGYISHKRFFTPRWDLFGTETYGIGCGQMALGDAKQLQLMERRKLQGIDKNVRPPMMADASLRGQRSSTVPDSTTYVNGLITGRPGFAPVYQVNPYLNDMREEIMRIEGHIDEAYYKNLFLIIADLGDQPNITATQITALREEKLLMLGPVLERLNDELLDPLIDTIFEMMMERGLIMPPPPELQGANLGVEYISILAQAQKAMGLGNIERTTTFIGGLAQLFGPNALDKLNLDETIDEYAEATAIPPKLIVPTEQAQQSRSARAEEAAQANAMAAGQAAAAMGKDLAGMDLSGDNALSRTMDAMGVAGGPV